MKLYSMLFLLFFLSCNNSPLSGEDESNNMPDNDLNIYEIWKQNTPLEIDSNDYYHFAYNPSGESESDYGTIKYTTEIPETRVYWATPDSFFVYYQNQLIGEPIINFSTFSGSDGYGQQLFYVYSDFIGDTLTIYGYIYAEIIDTVYVIVD